MELITRPWRRYHVSYDTVTEIESAILADPRVVAAESHPLSERMIVGATRLLRRSGADIASILRAGSRTGSSKGENRDYLAVMMEVDAARVAPWFIRDARKSIYLWDAWPGRHSAVKAFVESWGVQYAFVSSSQAVERLSRMSEKCTFVWVPEAIDPDRYQHRPVREKDIDVLQLGRKYEAHHEQIVPALQKAGKTYLYEREKGRIIFPAREEFVSGLARSKVSICVPSSLTHPERAGDIETMTLRYLQSIVSKSVVLGHAPAEMVELFGYNPVVEIDMADPAGQVLDILSNYENYLSLVERNFNVVTGYHTWSNRWQRIAGILFAA